MPPVNEVFSFYFPRSGQGDKILKVDHMQLNYDGPLIFTKESLFSEKFTLFSSSLQPSPRTRVFPKIFNHILSSFGGSDPRTNNFLHSIF